MLPETITDESDPRYHQTPPIGQPQPPLVVEEPVESQTPSEPTITTPESLAQVGQRG